jgi:hypothetical protein
VTSIFLPAGGGADDRTMSGISRFYLGFGRFASVERVCAGNDPDAADPRGDHAMAALEEFQAETAPDPPQFHGAPAEGGPDQLRLARQGKGHPAGDASMGIAGVSVIGGFRKWQVNASLSRVRRCAAA